MQQMASIVGYRVGIATSDGHIAFVDDKIFATREEAEAEARYRHTRKRFLTFAVAPVLARRGS